MTYQFSADEATAIPKLLSAPRFATYLRAANADKARALALYQWNAEVSAALLTPLQLCEVAIRNATTDAIEAVHGPNWPWSRGFRRSLPNPQASYNQQRELQKVSSSQPTAGKVVAELRFSFWPKIFTARHDHRIWDQHLSTVLPNLPEGGRTAANRQVVHDEIDRIRDLRNRIAHHEPIFFKVTPQRL